jgi:hypothetical protein
MYSIQRPVFERTSIKRQPRPRIVDDEQAGSIAPIVVLFAIAALCVIAALVS